MPSASVRFYGPLNDFLPAALRQATLVCAFKRSASVKDLVEALGVPHPEIDLLVVNRRLVDFAYLVRDRDRVAVYPPFRAFDLGDAARALPRILSVSSLRPHLLAWLALLAHEPLPRNGLRGSRARQPRLSIRAVVTSCGAACEWV